MNYTQLVKAIDAASRRLLGRAASVVNQALVIRNWLVGAYIVEFEQGGKDRADYGARLLETLATDLADRNLKGLEIRNLRNCRLLDLRHPQIRQTLSPEFTPSLVLPSIRQTPSAEFSEPKNPSSLVRNAPSPITPLSSKAVLQFSWSQIVELIRLDDPLKRAFYENQCLKGNGSVRQLQRQIGSLLYERTGLSRNEPAEILLRRLSDRKAELRRKKFVSAGPELQPLPPSDELAPVPKSWSWVRLGQLVEPMTNGIYKPEAAYDDSGIACLRMYNIKDGRLNFQKLKRMRLATEEIALYGLRVGDVLVNRVNSRELVGKAAVVGPLPEPLVFESKNIRVRLLQAEHLPEFISVFIQTKQVREAFEGDAKQTCGQASVNQPQVANLVMPLPPLAEQKRIVAKVEELLALGDALEARQTAAREHRARLVHSALDHLTAAQDEAEFRKHFAFILHNSSLILDSVPALRQAILSLAVQGRLVPQNLRDGYGREAIKKILGQRGITPSTPESAADDLPSLPANWAPVSMADVFEVAGGIQKTPLRAPRENAFPYLRVANVQRGRLDLTDVRKFELFDGDLDRWRLEPKDVLVVEGNGSEDEIGRCAQWNGEIRDCVHQNHIIRCRPFGHDARFALLFLNSPVGVAEMKGRAITTSGLYSLSVGKIRSLTVPFPPLAEQRRIVAKVNELLRWCDQLEARLTAARTTATHLLDVILRQLLAA